MIALNTKTTNLTPPLEVMTKTTVTVKGMTEVKVVVKMIN